MAKQPSSPVPMKPLAVLIAMYCSGAMADPAAATDTTAAPADNLGEIVVTGLRQSLVTNETIKRNASGIVDAITAEDIGKFPDTNLAESIQRIPGVTIDRVNNEGSRVTVRGFGPEFNMVTLNGRSMPANHRAEHRKCVPVLRFRKSFGRRHFGNRGVQDRPRRHRERRHRLDHQHHHRTTVRFQRDAGARFRPRPTMTGRPKSAARSRRISPACSAIPSSTIGWVS